MANQKSFQDHCIVSCGMLHPELHHLMEIGFLEPYKILYTKVFGWMIVTSLVLTLALSAAVTTAAPPEPLTGPSSTETTEIVLFQDDFNDGDADGWEEDSDDWSVVNGEYVIELSGQDSLRSRSLAGDPSWQDYTYEADVMGTAGVDKIIVFRYMDHDNFYGLSLRSGSFQDIYLVKCENGPPGEHLKHVSIPNQLNEWYHLKIVVRGERIQAYVDGQRYIDYLDAGTEVTSGRIGVEGWTGAYGVDSVHFDNVRVTAEAVEADFTGSPTSGVAPLTVNFTNQSTGDYTSSLWHFGDGVTSTLENPAHTYTAVGVYSPTLTVSGLGGTDSFTRARYITAYGETVEADFVATPTVGVAPLTVNFINTSIGDYADSLWIFGDSVTSTLQSPTHTYTEIGLYTPILIVTGPGGTDVEIKEAYITVEEFKIYLPLVVRGG